MTSSAQVEAKFLSTVFTHSSLVAITPNVVTYDFIEDSEPELDPISHQGEINTFQLLVGRGEEVAALGRIDLKFTIQIGYYRSKNTFGGNWRAVRDVFDVLNDRIRAVLYPDLDGAVDFYTTSPAPPRIAAKRLFQQDLWEGIIRLEATKAVNLN